MVIILDEMVEQYVMDKIVTITFAIIWTNKKHQKLHCNVTCISLEN